MAGTTAAFGITLAQLERERTGVGQYLETSLYEAAIGMVAHFLADYTGSGILPAKSGQYFAFPSPTGSSTPATASSTSGHRISAPTSRCAARSGGIN